MNTQHHSYPSFELSPFCTNDQVFTSAATSITRRYDLPDHDDLLNSLNRINHAVEWPLTLIVIGLGPFKAGQFTVDDHISNIGTLGVAAKLQNCVSRCNSVATADTDSIRDRRMPNLKTPHTVTMSGDQTPRHTELYRLTDFQFAALTIAAAASVARLCESMLSTLDQPLYVGEQPLTTSAHIGIARGHQYGGRPESHLRAAQSALFAGRQG